MNTLVNVKVGSPARIVGEMSIRSLWHLRKYEFARAEIKKWISFLRSLKFL